jgi:1-deoxy-D-xylulose-5-phosphate reductoisomerase
MDLALANKESLVAGGRLVMEAAEDSGAMLLPVDSEHSAIFQCLQGEPAGRLKRIILTASGGPFRRLNRGELRRVTVEKALAHPTWNMGPKVTIDSATLMNKGLEVLEAHHLFGIGLDFIDVVVHPQSVIHSMIEMVDSSVLAQMGVPDMRVPIQYALTFPDRMPSLADDLSLEAVRELTFEPVDEEKFPCLALAYEAGATGGTAPAAMNAANEEAVKAFMSRRIGFTDIPEVIERTLSAVDVRPVSGVDDVLAAESEARVFADRAIAALEKNGGRA